MSIENFGQGQSEILNFQKIQFALDKIGIGIHFVGSNGRFLYVNSAACAMLGYTSEEMLKMSVWDIDPNYSEEDFEETTKLLRDLSSAQIETTQKTKDGNTISVKVTFHYFLEGDNEQGHFISFIEDITKQKQIEAERERLHSQTLYSHRMEALGHLAGGIAHEFNNILATMMGFAELATFTIEDQKENASAEILEYLNEILISGNRAKELISQIQIFSRYQDKISDDKTATTPLQPTIEGVTNLLRASFPATININSHIEDPNLMAKINSLNLHQILLNLGINAQHAVGKYGSINISCKKRSLFEKCSSCHEIFNGDYIEISMSDTGKGIPEEVLSRVFDPFFSTKEIGEGSGMGLSIVHGLVHASNGHITVSTRKNEGTTVSFFLPQVKSEKTNPASHRELKRDSIPRLDDLRIMVVEDEQIILANLNMLLTKCGARVNAYYLPEEALAYFEQEYQNINLVITDESMPRLSGLDLSQKMLKIRPDLPIILCTGYSKHIVQKVAHKTGIAAFLNKPIEFRKLVQIINEVTKK